MNNFCKSNLTNLSKPIQKPFLHYYYMFSSFSVLVSNLVYFLLLLIKRKLNKLSYVHIHQINLVGLFQGILVTSWSFSFRFQIEDETLYQVVCFTSELLWGTLKHVRAYSVMTLAIYRYMAVFHNLIYKKISASYKYIILSILFAWIFPIVTFLIVKYATRSKSNETFCLDGQNENINMIYVYFSVTSFIGFVTPAAIVCILYVRIKSELNKRFKRLKIIEMICPFNTNSSSSINQNERIKRNKKLMNQVIVVNMLEIVSFCNVVILTMPIEEFFKNFDVVLFDYVLGSLNNFVLAFIPVVTLYFMPFRFDCSKNRA